VRRIQNFVVEDLSNWYIRRARRRFWAEALDDDKKAVYATAYEVLVGISKLIAPVAPFLSDEIYLKLVGGESVHLSLYPEADDSLIDDELEQKMDLVRDIVSLGRGVREKEKIKVRQPLPAVLVDGKYEQLIGGMEDLIKEELNIKEVQFKSDLGAYMNFSVKPDFKAAGPKLGGRMKAFAASLGKADASALLSAIEGGASAVWSISKAAVVAPPASETTAADTAADTADDQVLIDESFLSVQISAKEGFAVAMEGGIFTILDTTQTEDLVAEGLSREFVSKVQQIRKNIGLEMMDNIEIRYSGDEAVAAAVEAHADYMKKETLAVLLKEEKGAGGEAYDLNGHKTEIAVSKV
jgi:isoleucyl-tRNA synthetase